MSVTIKDAEHIAKLARLSVTEEETVKYTEQLNSILQYVEKLNELETDNVEPLSYPIENTNVFREDIPVKSIETEAGLRNAPKKSQSHFKVPKVISQD